MGRALIDEEMLAQLPDMSLREFLERHQLVRFRGSGSIQQRGGEALYVQDRGAAIRGAVSSGRYVAGDLYINDRREFDVIGVLRDIRISEIRQIQILSSTDISSRYGGDGRVPGVAIRMKRRGG